MVEMGLTVYIVTDLLSNDMVVESEGIWTIERPDWVGDGSQQVLDWLRGQIGACDEPIMLLQATNPMVDLQHLKTCKDTFERLSIPALVSINPFTCKPDGNIYITRDRLFCNEMWVAYPGLLNRFALDIDTFEDYCIGLAIWRYREVNVL